MFCNDFELANLKAVISSELIRDDVAKNCTNTCAYTKRPEIKPAHSYNSTKPHHDECCWNEQRDKGKAFTKCDSGKNKRPSLLMQLDELNYMMSSVEYPHL